MENLVEQVKRMAPDGFRAEILIAKQMRFAAGGQLGMITLCDELEEAAKAGDAERCAKARKMLLNQAQLLIKRIPASSPVLAAVHLPFKSGMKKGEEIGNKLFTFLEKRRKQR